MPTNVYALSFQTKQKKKLRESIDAQPPEEVGLLYPLPSSSSPFTSYVS